MQSFNTLLNFKKKYSNIVIALGTFDGVHIGHQKIIKRAVDLAKQINGTSMVFTFSNHPLSVIAPEKAPLIIANNSCKEKIINNLEVELLMNLQFNQKLLKLSPLDFLHLLKENFDPRYIVVGSNYTFGYEGKGTPELLKEKELEFGFKTEIYPVIFMDNKIISSTLIRSLITKGNLPVVNEFLGRNFSIRGKVMHGDKRGRLIGFPTANLALSEKMATPPNGVYAVNVLIDNMYYKAIANIGTNPTFAGTSRHVEVYILNFKNNIYDKMIDVFFLDKIREEKCFSNINELIAQIKKDIEQISLH